MKKLLFIAIMVAIDIYGQSEIIYTSIQELAIQSKIEVELKSLGGYQGNCVQLELENKTKEQLHIWLEAGRRLDNTNPGQQDILVVKEQKVDLQPGATKTILAFGFCCMADQGAPSSGTKFELGWMEKDNLLWIAQFINSQPALEHHIIQSAVWIFSNGNNPAGIIDDKNENTKTLKRAIADKLNIEMPWYEIYYERDSARVFSDKHYKLNGTIEYALPNRGWVTMLVRGQSKQVLHRFTETAFVEGGNYTYEVDLNIKNWPKGKYDIEIYLDDAMKKKINFTI